MTSRIVALVALVVGGAILSFDALRGVVWVLFEVDVPSPLWMAFEKFGLLTTKGELALGVFYLLALPSLLLWSLIEVQPTERGKALVSTWAIGLCLCTAPLLVGLVLCLPVLFFVLLPMVREHRTAARANRGGEPPQGRG